MEVGWYSICLFLTCLFHKACPQLSSVLQFMSEFPPFFKAEEYFTVCLEYILLFYSSVDEHLVASMFYLLGTMLLCSWVYKYLFKILLSICLGFQKWDF